MFHPAPVNAPIIHQDATGRDIGVQLGADVRGIDTPEINSHGLQQPFIIIYLQPKMLLQAQIDAWVSRIINRRPSASWQARVVITRSREVRVSGISSSLKLETYSGC